MREQFYWLSFCDADKPAGTQFLGGCLVRASDIIEAVKVAHALGINPGGEVQGLLIPPGPPPADKWIERLLSREEIDEMDREMLATEEAAS